MISSLQRLPRNALTSLVKLTQNQPAHKLASKLIFSMSWAIGISFCTRKLKSPIVQHKIIYYQADQASCNFSATLRRMSRLFGWRDTLTCLRTPDRRDKVHYNCRIKFPEEQLSRKWSAVMVVFSTRQTERSNQVWFKDK